MKPSIQFSQLQQLVHFLRDAASSNSSSVAVRDGEQSFTHKQDN